MIDDMDRRTSLKKKEQTCKHTDDVDNRTSVKKKEHNSYENTWTKWTTGRLYKRRNTIHMKTRGQTQDVLAQAQKIKNKNVVKITNQNLREYLLNTHV